MARRIAAVTIGQSPRPDLLEPLLARLPGDVEVVEVGALDQLSLATLPGPATPLDNGSERYPLTTRLRDGTRVTLDEAQLAPLVQAAIDAAEQAGATVTLLLCAGGFLDATTRGTLVRPFEVAVEQLRTLGARRIAVVVPIQAQAGPATRKWLDAGFDPAPIVGDPGTLGPVDLGVGPAGPEVPARTPVGAIVLDYVGHSAAAVAALRSRTDLPVVDLGECGADAAARHYDHHSSQPSGASKPSVVSKPAGVS